MRRRRNSAEGIVYEKVLKVRWVHWRGPLELFVLEVELLGKWFPLGFIISHEPRELTKKDVNTIAKIVKEVTDGEVAVTGLQLVR